WHMAGISKALIAAVGEHGLPAIAVVGENWPVWDVHTDHWLALMRHGSRRDRVLRPSVRSLIGRVVAPTSMDGAFERVRPAYCSEFLRRDVEEGFPPWRGRGVTVHNGIDFATMSRERDPKEPLGRPLRLLYCGRVERRKGVGTAVEALAALHRRDIDSTLDVVGWRDEAFASELRSKALSLGVADAVRLREPVAREDMPDLYRAHDVLVFPTIWQEPFGLVPLEAMAAGCLVVGTGTGGSGEVMIDGRTALLHAPEDPEGLASRVERLTQDPALVAGLRVGGRATANEHGIEGYHRALVDLLAGERGRST
ncbi:MAG: glycosyltransferase family 4 protein, partial [Actinobacteria bacterium]